MFTGIITGMGRITASQDLGGSLQHGRRLTLSCPASYLDDVGLGDSIALNGACMTVVRVEPARAEFVIEISAESLAKTTGLVLGAQVNLEKALRASDRLGGHLVSGHVDGVGTVLALIPKGESWELRIRAERELAPYLAYKGSIAVNGVSLTINHVLDQAEYCEISINLIAHTVQHTCLGLLQAGAGVNLEIDTVARYVQRMLTTAATTLKDQA